MGSIQEPASPSALWRVGATCRWEAVSSQGWEWIWCWGPGVEVCLTLSSWSPLPNAFLLFILKEYLSEHISMCWVLLAMCLGHCLEFVGRKLSAFFWGITASSLIEPQWFYYVPSLSPTLRLKRSKLTRTLIPKGNAQPPTEHNFLRLFCYHLLCGTSWPRSSGLWISDQFKIKFGPGLIPLENSAKFMNLAKAFWGQVIGVLCYHFISYRGVWQVLCRMEIVAWPANASECDRRCAVVTSHHNVIFTLYSNLDMHPYWRVRDNRICAEEITLFFRFSCNKNRLEI